MKLAQLADALGLIERALRCARDRDPKIAAGCRTRVGLELHQVRRLLGQVGLDRHSASLWWIHLDQLERAYRQSQWRTVWGELSRLYNLCLCEQAAKEVLRLCASEATN